MGKFQKSNKHKKIKFVDPFYHGERKDRMHAGRNLVPTTTEQGLSRSMKDLMRRTKQAKELDRKSRRQKKEIFNKRMLAQLSTEGAEREFAEIPSFKQKKGEKRADFMRRVDAAAMMSIKESQIEASFKTDHDPVTEDKQEPKSSKRKEKLKMRKQLKKEKANAKREDRKDDFHKFKDKVEFGEVVHGLPSLSVRPKHATVQNKPAVKSLLLYDMLNKNSRQDDTEEAKTSHRSVKSSKARDKGTKRKLLSPAQQLKMDKERQNIIDLYRQMKKTTAGTS